MQASLQKLSVHENYAGKHILLTGATGFVGKVLLSMLLERLSTSTQIYILIRGDKTSTATERFTHLLLSSPVFTLLRKKYKDSELLGLIGNKIIIIEGDVTKPNLGIDSAIAQELYQKLDLVIHLAGLVEFSPSVQLAFDINVMGTIHAADFTTACHHAALAHISTCYVAGSKNGLITEELMTQAPLGQEFDVELEIKTLQDSIAYVTQNITQQTTAKQPVLLEKALIELGQQRAAYWGWTNTYTYTKALAEFLLASHYPQLKYTIVRPSIVESAISYPFSGWNEGYNTCGPYCYFAGSWYPYGIAKKQNVLDVIPVDFVGNAILIIGAALLQDRHYPIYQVATSYDNPLTVEMLSKYTRSWHRQMQRQNGNSWIEKYLRCLKPLKPIPPNHFLAPIRLAKFIQKINERLKKLGTNSLVQKTSRQLKIMVRTLNYLHKIHVIYQPFLHDNCYFFVNNAIKKIAISEPEFQYNTTTINWKDYWLNSQMPGLDRWVFPALKNENDSK